MPESASTAPPPTAGSTVAPDSAAQNATQFSFEEQVFEHL
jgi:hypothetical protein